MQATAAKTENDSGVPGVETKGTTAVFDHVSQSGAKKVRIGEIIDADASNAALVMVARLRPKITEEPIYDDRDMYNEGKDDHIYHQRSEE